MQSKKLTISYCTKNKQLKYIQSNFSNYFQKKSATNLEKTMQQNTIQYS